jgi:hypothetical protein
MNITTKCILGVIAISLAAAAPSFAKTLKLPNEEFPIASIDFPGNWEPEEIDNGVAAQSPDEAVYLAAVAVGSEKGMNAEIEDTFEFLKEHNVELNKDSKTESKFKIGDLEAEELTFQGKDEDGPASVSIAFVTVKDKVVVLTYWVSTDKEKAHQEEVGKIVRSLKPSK